jgi:hypothetical protein
MELKQTTVIEFDYNIEALEKFKAETNLIDRKDIDKVQTAVKDLVKMRGAIQKKGKTYRDDANAFNKMVLTKEKEYVGIIEPLEIELKEVLQKEEERKVIEVRKELLPMKKQQLSMLKVTMPDDEFLLNLNEEEWVACYSNMVALHNDALKVEKEKEEQERIRIEREAQIKKEVEERAEKDKIRAIEEERQKSIDREIKLKQEQEEKERKQKEFEENAIQQEIKKTLKLEADKKYQDFLRENNYNQETDIIINGDEIKLYRIVNKFKQN